MREFGMRFYSLVLLFVAQSASAEQITDPELLRQLNELPPCKSGAKTCEPWERDWSDSDNRFAKYVQQPDAKLGPGQHTLIISDRDGMTRIDYSTGKKCKRARNAIRLQTAPPPNSAGVIYAPSSVKAFCVPR